MQTENGMVKDLTLVEFEEITKKLNTEVLPRYDRIIEKVHANVKVIQECAKNLKALADITPMITGVTEKLTTSVARIGGWGKEDGDGKSEMDT